MCNTETMDLSGPLSPPQQLSLARQIIEHESMALFDVAKRIGGEFCRAVDYLYRCRGSVIVCGIGKAGLVGQKIASTLASTGTRSHFLHAAEALHGEIGRIHSGADVMLILSNSGETEELFEVLQLLESIDVPILAITGNAKSVLGEAATVVLEFGPLAEADPVSPAPSTSTTVMLALGDALALVASRMRNFTRDDFARCHPAGSLGLASSAKNGARQ